MIWIIFGGGGTLTTTNSYGNVSKGTEISVSIISTYSGGINRSTGQDIFISGGNYRTNLLNPIIDISMSNGSSFTIIGSINGIITGSSTGAITVRKTIALDAGDGLKTIQSLFMTDNGEPYTSEPISIILDQTPPNIPLISGTNENSLLTGSVYLTWQSGSDSMVGFSHYKVHISLSPGFFGEITFITTGNSLEFGEDVLPKGTIFWYIEAYDLLGNISQTQPTFFHYKAPSRVEQSFGGGFSPYTPPSVITTTTGSMGSGQGIINSGDNTDIIPEDDKITTETPPQKVEIIKNDKKNIINNTNTVHQTSGNQSLKDSLLSGYHNAAQDNIGNIIIPDQSLSGDSTIHIIDPSGYKNLINNYHLGVNPLGYTLNYISRLIFPFYYFFRILQYFLAKILQMI